ncbi:MAG: hypothetical protein J7J93_03260 [Candidatus Aenigmarchaeota archaeon]|nr:hypothetical protein [Candidatus Aenigmarchaeota archaeon]
MKSIQIKCPKCGSTTNELIECEDCGAIGCTRCMKKKYGKWVCHKCEISEQKYYSSDNYYSRDKESSENDVNSAFSAMFG